MEYGSEWASDNIVVGAFESELSKHNTNIINLT